MRAGYSDRSLGSHRLSQFECRGEIKAVNQGGETIRAGYVASMIKHPTKTELIAVKTMGQKFQRQKQWPKTTVM